MTEPADVLAILAGTDYEVAIEPPGGGEGYWAGGPSAVWQDGSYYLAYRLRRPVTEGRGYANVVARSSDGVTFETIATVTSNQFNCASLERPALVPLANGGWRLYVSCSTWHSKHWWVEAIHSDDLAGLADGNRVVVLPGDNENAWKDVVVSRDGSDWRMWACRHPLDVGDAEADRMTSVLFTSGDGLVWTQVGTALAPAGDGWDSRGTRIVSVLRSGDSWTAYYDGRASATENWFERTGVAVGSSPDAFAAEGGPTPSGRTARYLSIAESPTESRIYWEASRDDGANELRTAKVPRPLSPNQS